MIEMGLRILGMVDIFNIKSLDNRKRGIIFAAR